MANRWGNNGNSERFYLLELQNDMLETACEKGML